MEGYRNKTKTSKILVIQNTLLDTLPKIIYELFLMIYILQYISQQMSSFQIYSSPDKSQRQSPLRNYNQRSPSKYDADFYLKKIQRLEAEIMEVSENYNKAKMRLRRAEDFQIKYDILFKQKMTVENDNISKEKELFELRTKNEQLNMIIRQKHTKHQQNGFEKMSLLREIEIWKQKALQAQERNKLARVQQQNKANQKIQMELITIKRNFSEAEEEYRFQIARLNKQIHQKKSVDNSVNEKNQKIKRQKENQIERLQKIIQKNRQQYLQMVEEKNKQIEQTKLKFEHIFNNQLGYLKNNMNNQDEKFTLQLEGLRKIIQIKNVEIQNLQKQLKYSLQANNQCRQQLNFQIDLLKSKLYQREKINEEELYNMKQRLTSLHSVDVQTMKVHYDELIEGLRDERRQNEKIMNDKDNKIQLQKREFQRIRDDLNKIINDKDEIIKELKQKYAFHGDTNTSQINNLQQALNRFSNQKQKLNTEYQANIAFLNQQIIKLTSSNELKNNEIKQLHEYNAVLKKQHFYSLKELQTKWKNQRKQRQTERQKERDLRQKIEEEYKQKQKNWKNKERQLERQLEKEKRQKNKWSLNNERLQKQLQRLYKQNNQLQQLYQSQLARNQKTLISNGGAKRDLANELQRQKIDLQTLKRMEVEQIKKKYQLQFTRLSNLNEKLQNELSQKKIDYDNIEEEFKKVSSQYRNMEKINKDKIADYNKKMTTLNSQILLTQNLYQSLINAKTRVNKKDSDK